MSTVDFLPSTNYFPTSFLARTMFANKPPPNRLPTKALTNSILHQQNQSLDPLRQQQVAQLGKLVGYHSNVDNILAAYQTREGSNGYYFKSRLPFELFLEVISHLDRDTIKQASHTCSTWRKVIIEKKELWNELEINLGDDLELTLARISTLACRSQSSLRKLNLYFSANFWEDDSIGPEETKIAFNTQRILVEIARLDGCKNLRNLSLNLCSLALMHYGSAKLQVIEQILYFVRFSAVSLEHFKLEVPVSGLPAYRIARCLLSLHTLELIATSDPEDIDYDEIEEIPPIFFGTSHNLAESSLLKELYLADSIFHGSDYDFPFLQSVELFNVELPNLHGFLSSISSTLVKLTLNNVFSGPYHTFASLPAVLELPLLEKLHITGRSPSLFETPQTGKKFFTISAPTLKHMSFADITTNHNSEMRFSYPILVGFEGVQLSILLRLSPSLQSLDLNGLALGDNDLSLLADTPSTLSHLTLSSPVTDSTIQSLHEMVPSLKSLDVRNSLISLPSLARLFNRYKKNQIQCKLEDEQATPKVAFKMTTTSRIPKDSPNLQTQNKIARDLCNLNLSSTQVQHLVNTLSIDSPPNGKTYKDFKEEILSWKAHAKYDLDITGDDQTYIKAKKAIDLWIKISEETRAFQWISHQKEAELDFTIEV